MIRWCRSWRLPWRRVDTCMWYDASCGGFLPSGGNGWLSGWQLRRPGLHRGRRRRGVRAGVSGGSDSCRRTYLDRVQSSTDSGALLRAASRACRLRSSGRLRPWWRSLRRLYGRSGRGGGRRSGRSGTRWRRRPFLALTWRRCGAQSSASCSLAWQSSAWSSGIAIWPLGAHYGGRSGPRGAKQGGRGGRLRELITGVTWRHGSDHSHMAPRRSFPGGILAGTSSGQQRTRPGTRPRVGRLAIPRRPVTRRTGRTTHRRTRRLE